MKIQVIDLFCGIGGLTQGLADAGIDVKAGFDIDGRCKFAYEHNNNVPMYVESIEDTSSEKIINLYDENAIKALVGCAPCQPFSKYSYRYIKDGYVDNKWRLLYEFKRLIHDIKPDIVSMENVPQLSKTQVFSDFIRNLEQLGYYVSWKIVNCADYGVAQNRKRLVLLASRYNEIEIIPPIYTKDTYRTVRKEIESLKKIRAGEKSLSDLMHKSSNLNDINLKRIQQSKPGGTWIDWEEDLLAECHKKKSGKTYKSVYGRMEWDKPSPTITTQFYGYGNGRFGHPEQDRALSLREGALLQSFPLKYQFFDPEETMPQTRVLSTHIGNAVPVKLGEAIGMSMIEHIKKNADRGEVV